MFFLGDKRCFTGGEKAGSGRFLWKTSRNSVDNNGHFVENTRITNTNLWKHKKIKRKKKNKTVDNPPKIVDNSHFMWKTRSKNVK
jgi:hypothetical protein